jgi:hypothetical protein
MAKKGLKIGTPNNGRPEDDVTAELVKMQMKAQSSAVKSAGFAASLNLNTSQPKKRKTEIIIIDGIECKRFIDR